MTHLRIFLFLLFAPFITLTAISAQTQESPAAKEARMAWWKDAKFGLFIHWGIYSVAAGEYNGQKDYGEWLMYEAKVPIPEYEKLAPQFNPTQFNAEEWVTMAKNAGMKYIVITSKHHDGFGIFDSKVSNYDIMDRTPFQRDPLRELADECRKQGIKLCFYHSIMDWHHPHATKADFSRYRDEYMLPQLKELLTNYGDIGVLWFDGEWIEEWTEEQGKALYNYIRGLQPNIIINNRVGKGRNGMQGMNTSEKAAGDFGTPEQEILAEKSTLDWESCMTMNDHWGYCRNDKNFKPTEELIWNLIDITAKGGNFLLNVGPTGTGLFPQESIDRLRQIGDWVKVNNTAIYGTTPWQHWQEGDDIRYTHGKNGDVFALIRHCPSALLLKKITPNLDSKIYLLGQEQPIPWKQGKEGVELQLPANLNTNNAIVLRIKGQPTVVSAVPTFGDQVENDRKNIVFSQQTAVVLKAKKGAKIYYTTDGSLPTTAARLYKKPFSVTQSTMVRAMAKQNGKMSSEVIQKEYIKARCGIEIQSNYAPKYAANGPFTLVDGKRGSTNFNDGKWLGFEGTNCIATLDLGHSKPVDAVDISFLRVLPSWIFLPEKISVFASNDGQNFSIVNTQTIPAAQASDDNRVAQFSLPIHGTYRYIKVEAAGIGNCPAWHAGAGAKSWVFVDEIEVR
jgi:alpha-L-fucosidase